MESVYYDLETVFRLVPFFQSEVGFDITSISFFSPQALISVLLKKLFLI